VAALSSVELTPTAFVELLGTLFGDRPEIIDGERGFGTASSSRDPAAWIDGGGPGVRMGGRVAARTRIRRPFMPVRASKRLVAHGLRVVHSDRNVSGDRETMGEIV